MKKIRNKEIDGRFYTDEYIGRLVKRIYELENIINELEKWCDRQFNIYKDLDKIQDSRISCQYLKMKDKLKELKEGK